MSSGFQFGLPKTSSGIGVGFSFGSPSFGTSPSTAPTSAVSSIGSGTVTNSSVSPSLNFGLTRPFGSAGAGTTTLQTTSTSQIAQSSLTFGLAPTQTSVSAAPTQTTVSFGSSTPQSTPSLGTSAITTAVGSGVGGFSFGLNKPVLGQPTVMSSVNAPTLTSTAASSFAFGLPKGTPSTVSTAATPIVPSFGIVSQPTAPPASTPSTAAPATFSATPNAPATQSTTVSLPNPTCSSTSLSFGSTLQSSFLGASKPFGSPLNDKTDAAAKIVTTVTTATSLTSTSIGLNIVPTGTTTASLSTPQIPVSAPSVPKPSTLSFHQLEEHVNKWAQELEEQERYFMDEADRINQWDQALMSNGEKIGILYDKVDTCKKEQTKLEQELDFIDSQQKELEKFLETLERTANELPPGHLHSDFEREAVFQLATNVDLELGQLLSDLREMTDLVNADTSKSSSKQILGKAGNDAKDKEALSTGTDEGLDTVQQVTRILNCHMHSLNWIHESTQDLIERVKLLEGS